MFRRARIGADRIIPEIKKVYANYFKFFALTKKPTTSEIDHKYFYYNNLCKFIFAVGALSFSM